MRDEDLFIRHTIEGVNDLRKALGLGPLEQEKAYRLASFLWKRYQIKGWQFSPPLMPMTGGLTGGRRKD
jgi:hypothetical protein